jgi:predicted GNAT family N-acyltransferase
MSRRGSYLEISPIPQTKRAIERLIVPEELGLSAVVCLEGGEEVKAKVLDLAPNGIAIFLEPLEFSKFEKAKILNVQILLGSAKLGYFANPAVVNKSKATGKIAFSVSELARRIGNSSRRARDRTAINDRFRPTILAKDPLYTGELLHFDVVNINVEGVGVKTSLRNRHLINGLKIRDATLTLPGIGVVQLNLVIKFAYVEEEFLNLGMKIENRNEVQDELIGQFLIFGSKHQKLPPAETLESLKRSGFSEKRISKGLKFEIVSSPNDYENLLQLRFLAYRAAGKTPPEATHSNMADEFDSRAVIIVAKANGTIFGTIRLVRCRNENDRFPFEAYFDTTTIFSEKERFNSCEISRLAVHPDAKGTDIAANLVKRALNLTYRSNLEKIFVAASAELQKIYSTFGMLPITTSIPHPNLAGSTMCVLAVKPSETLVGKGISAHVWDYMVKDSALHLQELGIVNKLPNRFLHSLKLKIEEKVMKRKKGRLKSTK